MLNAIREVVQNILEHWGLADYVCGTVVAQSPLRIRIDDRLFLVAQNLIFTTGVGSLQLGDKLVMLRVARGQKYILLSKEVAV